MAQTIVRITFSLKIPRAAFEQGSMPGAQMIADVDGLQWKIWSLNEAENEFCGIYLFTNQAAAEAYVNGPIVARLKVAPFQSGITVTMFDVIESLTAITHGPIKEQAPTV